MYKVELLTSAREKPNDQTMVESYVRTALELHDVDERAFFGRFSGETSRVCSGFSRLKSDDVARQILGLHQRHGQAIWNVLTAAVKSHSAALVNGSLPPSSVLMMAVARGGRPALTNIGKRTDPVEAWFENEAESRSGNEDDVRSGRQRHRRKSQPTLERARIAIQELYPTGVPQQAAEPNTILCRRVGQKLKQAGLPEVSNDTILRAAGRRT
jgi:hypothetical protein